MLVAKPKVKMINLRLSEDTHDAFKIACELRGASMSSLLHQFVVKTIREEKELDPKAFGKSNNSEREIKGLGLTKSSKTPYGRKTGTDD